MILKASARGGGMQLAAHLLKDENEHVEVHEVRGFVSDDLRGAMKEAQGIAAGTRCKQHLFSVSLSPPGDQSVGTGAFESAIARIEQQTGLSGQPRIVVFHEKEGRRHCHAVWSRIDADTMTARSLPFFKMKLREISKGLYLEHGWPMPRGFMDSRERDPQNYNLAEWQQSKRSGRDPTQTKATIQECWAASDSKAAFAKALETRGLYLARGNARAFVAVTYEGDAVGIARAIGKRSKEVIAKLGPAAETRSVADTKDHIASVITPRLKGLLAEAERQKVESLRPLHEQRQAMRLEHRQKREQLNQLHLNRRDDETRVRASRLRTGIAGMWDRLTGQHRRMVKQNEAEVAVSRQRDTGERNTLVAGQLNQRRDLQRAIVAVRDRHAGQVKELHSDLARQGHAAGRLSDNLRDRFAEASVPRPILRGRVSGRASRGVDKPRGLDLGR